LSAGEKDEEFLAGILNSWSGSQEVSHAKKKCALVLEKFIEIYTVFGTQKQFRLQESVTKRPFTIFLSLQHLRQ